MRKQLAKASAFTAAIGLLFVIFWTLISSINLYALKAFTAQSASALLGAFGAPHALSLAGPDPAIIVNGVTALITNLCAGDVEIALLAAILLATMDRPLRRRLWGAAFGVALILVINPLRVAIVLAVGHYSGWAWADFSHDLLFRLTLITTILLYYFVWYVKYDAIATRIFKIVNREKTPRSARGRNKKPQKN